MMTDRTAQRQHLDDQIDRAKQAATTLAGLQAKTDALPGLQREKKRRDLQAASAGEMERATASARAALTEAAEILRGCRAGFTRLAADARVLAEDVARAQDLIYNARDGLTEPVRGAVTMQFFDDPRRGTPHAIDSAAAIALLSAFGEAWSSVGGTLPALAAFPLASSPEEHALIDVIGNAAHTNGRPLYHPQHAHHFNPFAPDWLEHAQ